MIREHIRRLREEKHIPQRNIRERRLLEKSGKRVDVATFDKKGKPFTVSRYDVFLPEILPEVKEQLIEDSEEFGNKFAIATDGYVDYCYEVIKKSGEIYLKEIPDIPDFSSNVEDVGRHSNNELIVTPNLFDIMKLLSIIIQHELFNEGKPEYVSHMVFARIIFAKYYDEISSDPPKFRATYTDSTEDVILRIQELFYRGNRKYNIFEEEDEYSRIDLSESTLKLCVYRLQNYSLIKSGIEKFSLAKVYNSGLQKGVRNISENIVDTMLKLANVKKGDKILDLACVLGHFLLPALKLGAKVYGMDHNVVGTIITKFDLFINGAKELNVFTGDCILPISHVADFTLGNVENRTFKTIVTFPPFGRIHHYHFQTIADFHTVKSNNSPMEGAFIERAWHILEPGGRLVILVPEGLLFKESLTYVRKFILDAFKVLGIISLPHGALFPFTGLLSDILVLEKTRLEDTSDNLTFMAEIKNVGYDRRGRPVKENDFPAVLREFEKFTHGNYRPDKEGVFTRKLSDDPAEIYRFDYIYHDSTKQPYV